MEIATNLGQLADFVAVGCTSTETERTLSNTAKCKAWIPPPGARQGHQEVRGQVIVSRVSHTSTRAIVQHPHYNSFDAKSGSFSAKFALEGQTRISAVPESADAHGTNSGDNKLPKQQSGLSATANSSESALVFGVAQNFARTSVWSADQCKVTWLTQWRELDNRVVLQILTLPEGNWRRARRQYQTCGSRPRQCVASHAEEAGSFCCVRSVSLLCSFLRTEVTEAPRQATKTLEIPWRRP